MSVFVIGDLHLSLGCDKPMDIFPGWQGYMQRLTESWTSLVQPEDTVVLAGDTSWAMKLENCGEDFTYIQNLPGKKLLLKGNHDYWWSTLAKMRRYTGETGFSTIDFIFNNAHFAEGMMLCGTRSWMYEPGVPKDEKVMARETGRLRTSLEAAQKENPGAEKVAFLHYPPIHRGTRFPEIISLMQEFGVKRCYYGHLHGQSIRYAFQGEEDGITYNLISADAVGFAPVRIPDTIV